MENKAKADNIRLSITLTKKQHTKIKAAAEELGLSISGFLSVAASEKIQRDSRKKTD